MWFLGALFELNKSPSLLALPPVEDISDVFDPLGHLSATALFINVLMS